MTFQKIPFGHQSNGFFAHFLSGCLLTKLIPLLKAAISLFSASMTPLIHTSPSPTTYTLTINISLSTLSSGFIPVEKFPCTHGLSSAWPTTSQKMLWANHYVLAAPPTLPSMVSLYP